jgi:hypothetical protein
MKTQLAIVLLFSLCLIGCKPNQESLIPGTWKDTQGHGISFAVDKTYTHDLGSGFKEDGTWKIDAGDLVMTPVTLGGKPVADVKARALTRQRSKPMTQGIKNMIDDMDKPNFFKIGDDGMTMRTDKARDTNSGDPWVLTKQGS